MRTEAQAALDAAKKSLDLLKNCTNEEKEIIEDYLGDWCKYKHAENGLNNPDQKWSRVW